MSKFLPPHKVQAEQIAQLIRFSNGLKSGSYVRCLIGGRPASALRHRVEAAMEAGEDVKLLTELEYQAALKPPAVPATDPFAITNFEPGNVLVYSDEVPVTDAGTQEGPKSEN